PDALLAPEVAERAGLKSLFAMPLSVADRTEGLLAFVTPDATDPEPDVLAALEVVGGELAQYLEQSRRQQALVDSEGRARQLVDALEEGVLVVNAEGVVTDCNRMAGWLLDVEPAAVIGRRLPFSEGGLLLHADGTPITSDNDPIRNALATGEPERDLLMCVLRDGDSIWLEQSIHPLQSDAGQSGGDFVVSLLDVTERRRIERALRSSEAAKQAMLGGAIDCVIGMDSEGRVVEFNPAAERAFGYERAETIGRPVSELIVPPSARAAHDEGLRRFAAERTPGMLIDQRVEMSAMRKDGSEFPIELTVTYIDVEGELLFTGFVRDITERRESEQAIAHLAYHDQLTGLPNRALLEEHLEVALARGEREGRELALLYLDLDNFKLVNDSLGHAAGDQLLKMVAGRLSKITRASDLLARHGGDELLLLLTDIEGGATTDVAQSVGAKVLAALEEPFQIADNRFEIGASVGIAIFPDDGRSPAALLRAADATMYQAKAAGRNRVALHRPGLGIEGAGELISATTRLRRGMAADELCLYYQPILSVPDGHVVELEALLRWDDQRRGLVDAAAFMQLAEETGLIESIGEWAIHEVCRQTGAWLGDGLDVQVHLNLSARQLRQRHLVEVVQEAIDSAGIEPAQLTMEVAELAALAEGRGEQSTIAHLSELGVRLAIDDFGAGNSSLGRLRELPADELKLHRLLLRDVPHDPQAAAVARAVIDLATGLGMRAVAEGVENEAQWRFLAEHGCPLAQGFHLGRPAPPGEITRMLGQAA
ncbi:MAG: putative bifunctional diguanylate cyclase/phosphodiesterase, partial [Thermoleophilaceae bacterium]